jgi:hypothetical protein
VEAKPALVGPDRAVHLDPEASVHLHFAAIVHPRNAEHEDALRLRDPLEELRRAVFGMAVENGNQRLEDFLRGLVELGLGRVLRADFVHHVVDVLFGRRRLSGGLDSHTEGTHSWTPFPTWQGRSDNLSDARDDYFGSAAFPDAQLRSAT